MPTTTDELTAGVLVTATVEEANDEASTEELVLAVGDGVEVEQTDVTAMGILKLSKSILPVGPPVQANMK
jgi:hypothetical protein